MPLRLSELLFVTASALLAGPVPFWFWCSLPTADAVDTEAADFLGESFEFEVDDEVVEEALFAAPPAPVVGVVAGPDLEGVEPVPPDEFDVPGPPSLSLSLSFFPPFPPSVGGFFSLGSLGFFSLGLNSVMTTVTSLTVTL